MQKQLLSLIISLSLAIFNTALAANPLHVDSFTTADELYKKCDSSNCIDYFIGFIEGIQMGSFLNISPQENYMSANALRDIFMKHIKDNPKESDADAAQVITKSLIKADKAKLRSNPPT